MRGPAALCTAATSRRCRSRGVSAPKPATWHTCWFDVDSAAPTVGYTRGRSTWSMRFRVDMKPSSSSNGDAGSAASLPSFLLNAARLGLDVSVGRDLGAASGRPTASPQIGLSLLYDSTNAP